MAAIAFWGLRMVVGAATLFALFANWRVGMVLLLACAMDFMVMFGMIFPGFSLVGELVLVSAPSLVVGALIGIGKQALQPVWLAPVICAGLSAVLQGSTYGIGLAQDTLDPSHAVQILPSAVILVVASGIGLFLPAVLLRVTVRPRRSE